MSAMRFSARFCLLLVGAFLLRTSLAQSPGHPAEANSKYVGAEVCQGCHDDAYKSFAATTHLKTLKREQVSEQGCEGCHGPGADHAEAGDPDKIRRFPAASAQQIQAVCTVCHEVDMETAHMKARLTCLTCHSAHHYAQTKAILITPQNLLCQRCHKF
jgi:predicted CXXCH cytochrome family protein